MRVDGIEFVYVYIRKNACSSWKNFFINESSAEKTEEDWANPLGFMQRNHRVRSFGQIAKSANRIVVLREPLERLVSGFLNQYVMRLQRGSAMHDDVAKISQVPVAEITFRQFTEHYLLRVSPEDLNPHFYSQESHLAAVEYNRIWLMEELRSKVEALFGHEISERYFSRKVNATVDIPRYETRALDLPARKLFRRWSQHGQLPSVKALTTGALGDQILSYYAKDALLYCEAKDNQAERITK